LQSRNPPLKQRAEGQKPRERGLPRAHSAPFTGLWWLNPLVYGRVQGLCKLILRTLVANSHGNFLADGMSTLFEKSAVMPWNDAWTGDVYTSDGIRYDEIIAGTSPADNPRVFSVILTDPTASLMSGNSRIVVKGFAPASARSLKQINGTLVLELLFAPPGSTFTVTNLDY